MRPERQIDLSVDVGGFTWRPPAFADPNQDLGRLTVRSLRLGRKNLDHVDRHPEDNQRLWLPDVGMGRVGVTDGLR